MVGRRNEQIARSSCVRDAQPWVVEGGEAVLVDYAESLLFNASAAEERRPWARIQERKDRRSKRDRTLMALLVNQKTTRKTGVTIRILNEMAAARIKASP